MLFISNTAATSRPTTMPKTTAWRRLLASLTTPLTQSTTATWPRTTLQPLRLPTPKKQPTQDSLTTQHTRSTTATRPPTTQQKRQLAQEQEQAQARALEQGQGQALELARARARARVREQVLGLGRELEQVLEQVLARVLGRVLGLGLGLELEQGRELGLEQAQVLVAPSPWMPLPKPSMTQSLAFSCPQASAWTLWSRPSRILPLRTQR